MRFTPTVACLGVLLCASSPVLGQTGDGYIGIYRDSLGTEACASVPPYTSATLYMIAKTSGESARKLPCQRGHAFVDSTAAVSLG